MGTPGLDGSETRKVQVVGGTTYAISLPKQWVETLGIKAGMPMGLKLLPGGSIMLTPPGERSRPSLQFDLLLDTVDHEEVFRTIIGVYLGGYESIRVRLGHGSIGDIEPAVRDACDRVQGLVIVEKGTDFLLLQDILNPVEFNARKGIRRMHLEARSLLVDACRFATIKQGPEFLEALERRDDELDRLQLIIVKQHNLLMRDIALSNKMGIPLQESLNYLLVALYLERIGDYALRIARSRSGAAPLNEPRLMEKVQGTCNLAVKALDDAVAAFNRRDIPLAHQTIRLASNLGHLALTLPLEMVQSRRGDVSFDRCGDCLAFDRMCECFERVGLYAKSIAEVAINHATARRADVPENGSPRYES